MSDYSNKKLFAPKLSGLRNFLFRALILVWFCEMLFMVIQPLSKLWAYSWLVSLPENPYLLTALYVTWAVAGPAKAALWVMAIFGLRSKNVFTRTVLFVCMSLIPPLNIVFPFRQQGFLLRPMIIATVLSTILWGSFFLFRERAQQTVNKKTKVLEQLPSSRWEIIQYTWLAAYSTVLTLLAFLCLFWPRTALSFTIPCVSGFLDTDSTAVSSLVHTTLASGTHLLALATASWFATVNSRNNPSLRQAMSVACTLHAGLFLIFPLPQILVGFGRNCAASSILIVFVPLFIGWLIYTAFSSNVKLTNQIVTQ